MLRFAFIPPINGAGFLAHDDKERAHSINLEADFLLLNEPAFAALGATPSGSPVNPPELRLAAD